MTQLSQSSDVIFITSFALQLTTNAEHGNRLFERKQNMDVNGATDIATNANPPPSNPDTVSSKEANEFKETMDCSTTSNDRSTPSDDSSKQSQGTSNSYPMILATRPPINLAQSTGTNGTGAMRLSQGQVTAPKSENRPELEKIANDPKVSPEIDKAWNASNPNGPGAKHEKGFWVSKDDKTGALSVTPFPDNGTNDSLTPGSPPSEKGKTVVGFFHTHPNTNGEGYDQGPSEADERFAKSVGVPGLIRSHDGMYYFGPKSP
jgi:hypothetical protein